MACVSVHIFEGNDKGQIFSDKIKVILTKITLNPYTNIFYFFSIWLSGFCAGYLQHCFSFIWLSLETVILVLTAQNSLLLLV